MISFLSDDHVLPRPSERLPEYAHGKARQALADRFVDAFGLSQSSAAAIANAVVDPSEVRKSIGEPTDPDVERIPVPGGMLLGIRTSVWARRIMPDPRNPRTLPSRKHPFAVEPGSGAENSKFRPVSEPQPLDQEQPNKAELIITVENRHHLTWASQQARDFVLKDNDWRKSIASQGVMEAVWLVATTYQHTDGSAAATTLTTAEGSSRCTAVHFLLNIASADVPYDDNEVGLRNHIKQLNTAFDLGAQEKEKAINMRCERLPALILVGFRPHPAGNTGFPTALKSLVALRHVDPPKPWGAGPENESLADEVLDELARRDLISATERNYFAGSCTRTEATAAHLPSDPVLRASLIVRLFSNSDESVGEAIKVAVTSQSTRKNITKKLKDELATALILRAVADDPDRVDKIRRYLRHAFSDSIHTIRWQGTGRNTDQLVKDALTEVRQWINNGGGGEPGPNSVELAVRASYPLVVSGRLTSDRGSAGSDQPDRRIAGQVLDEMRRSIQGVHQLGQALRDYSTETDIRAVGEDGNIKQLGDGATDQTVNDVYLRREFPPPGKPKGSSPGNTPIDRYNLALDTFGKALEALEQEFNGLTEVLGDDSQPFVDARGLDPRLSDHWRRILKRVDEELGYWSRTFRRVFGAKVSAPTFEVRSSEEIENLDPLDTEDEPSAELEDHDASANGEPVI